MSISLTHKEVAERARDETSTPRPYWNPYVAGIGLGLTLVLTYYLMGEGLGASGAFTRFVAAAEQTVAPRYVAKDPYWSGYLSGEPVLKAWLVFEVLGALVGGVIAALTAGRFKVMSEHGTKVSARQRAVLAFAGGLLVGVATRFARGCTSGQALTGGSVLAVGSWAFMFAVFAGGYAAAWFVRRQWQ